MLMPKSEETMECQVEEGRRTGPYPLVSGVLMLVSARVGFIDRVRRARCRLYGGHVRFLVLLRIFEGFDEDVG